MDKYNFPFFQSLLSGDSTSRIQQNIINRFQQLRSARKRIYRHNWCQKMIAALNSARLPHRPDIAYLDLRNLWHGLHATRAETALLRSLYWAPRRPTVNAVITIPHAATTSTHQSTTTPSTIPTHPVRRNTYEDTVVRQLSLQSSLMSPVPESLYALIDLEGIPFDWIEVAVFIVAPLTIVDVYLDYALPCDIHSHKCSMKFCHGMDLIALQGKTSQPSSSLPIWVREYLSRFPIKAVLSADNNIHSDVAQMIKNWGYPYVNIPMPEWVDRVLTSPFLRAQMARTNERTIYGVGCDYQRLHGYKIKAPWKRNKHGKLAPPNDSKKAKANAGSHCAFYDALHLWLTLLDKGEWTQEVDSRAISLVSEQTRTSTGEGSSLM